MTLSLAERRLRALEAQVQAIGAWRDRTWVTVDDWTFQAPGGPQAPLRVGDAWPERTAGTGPTAVTGPDGRDVPALLRGAARVPDALTGGMLVLELDVGGEALVTVSVDGEQVYRGGLNPYHRRLPLGTGVSAGASVTVEVQAVARGLFGSPVPRPHLETARLSVPQPDVEELALTLSVTASAARALEERDPEVTDALLNVTEGVLRRLDWPSGADAHLARLHALGGGEAFTQGIWRAPDPLPAASPLPEDALVRVRQALAELRAGLTHLRERFPARGQLALSGHAHLDLGWLWPVHETRRKAQRTLGTVLELMRADPDFVFNQSSAQLYAWLEHDDPQLFAQLRERVQEGRVEPVGGMWVEPDAQMTGGEAMARQLLYGQRYFRETFGRTCTVAWLPDTFGFTPALPQLLLQAGVTGFFTTKLNWNEETRFPHDLFHWEGLDGSRVVAHSVDNPGGHSPGLGGYNGDVQAGDLLGAWGNARGRALPAWKERAPESLFTFGYGDGGGGPTGEMLQRYRVLRDFPALPRLRMTRVDEFFARLPRAGLPVWRGELYLQLHRGTLTAQARVKRLNRQAEHRLMEAEALTAWSGEVGADVFASLWKAVLLNQFHDILPGSSIREVYDTALPEVEGVVARAGQLVQAGQRAVPDRWTVANPQLWDRPLTAVLPDVAGDVTVTLNGERLPTQEVEGGLLVHADQHVVPACGQVTLVTEPATPDHLTASLPDAAVRASLEGDRAVLSHRGLRAVIGPDGTLTHLTDLRQDREMLGTDGHRLLAYPDLPYAWEAWDVAHGLDETVDHANGRPLDGPCTVQVLQDGPLRATVRVRQAWRESVIVRDFTLHADRQRLDVRTRVDWHERRTLLRAVTHTTLHAHETWAETAMGAQARANHRNMPHDAAQFEVSAHRWLDLSEPGSGLSVLNDGRYGHSALHGTLALSVVRGPMWPDPEADLGPHEFTYALYPHAGDWRSAGTVREGLDLNSPLVVLPGERDAAPPLRVSGLPLVLSALKRAEDGDGVIVRVYEAHGERGRATLHLAGLTGACRVNLLEDPSGDSVLEDGALDVTEGRVTFGVKPFEIVTLKVTRSF